MINRITTATNMILKLNKDFLLNFTILSNDDNKLQKNSLKTIQSNDL